LPKYKHLVFKICDGEFLNIFKICKMHIVELCRPLPGRESTLHCWSVC